VGIDQSSLTYYAYRLLGAVAPLIPPRLGHAMVSRIGNLTYPRLTASRENVCDNLRHVLGPQADPARIEDVARQVFQNQARNYFDLFRVASLSADQIRQLVTVKGLERVDQALSAGKGVIIVSAHLGNAEVIMQRFALQGYPITGVAEHLKPEKLYQYVASLRASKGTTVIPADGFLRPLFRALHNNEILLVAADRLEAQTGTLIDFFGAPALLPDWHVRLALRTSAKLLMAFSLRLPDNTFEAVAEPPLELERTDDRERDIRAGMAQVVALLEKYIGAHPEQWVMFQPIWRLPEHMRDS
jgi:lauroyl/myristoyl acyltransferase